MNFNDPSGYGIWSSIKNTAKKAVSAAKTVVKKAVTVAKAVVQKTVAVAKAVVKKVATAVPKLVTKAVTKTKKVVTSTYKAATTVAKKTVQSVSSYAKQKVSSAYTAVKKAGSAVSTLGKNMATSWSAALEKTMKHVCTTANRIQKNVVEFVQNVDWKKVAIGAAAIVVSTAAVALTGGLAAPAIAAALGTGLAGTVATGAVLGAVGGAAYSVTSSGLSGNDAQTVLKDTLIGGATGALTGGVLAGVGYGASTLISKFTSSGTSSASSSVVSQVDDVATGASKSGSGTTSQLDDLSTGVCFVAGTLILTSSGKRAIEDLKVGDTVYAKDTDSGAQTYKEVKTLYRKPIDTLVYLTIDDENIVATETHPFYVEGTGWVEAGQLTSNDKVTNSANQLLDVQDVETKHLDESITVYNFEVEDYHTYYVGESEILVHNSCAKQQSEMKNTNSKLQEVFDAADNYKLSDDVYNNHIVERHGSSGKAFPSKSKFNAEFDIKKGINDVLRSEQSIVKPNTAGRMGSIFEQTFNDSIGINSKGKALNTIKVVIDDGGNVVTAFPKK